MQMIARLADAAHLGHGLKGAKLAKVHDVVHITLLEPAWRAP
jgi:hypothetical protein